MANKTDELSQLQAAIAVQQSLRGVVADEIIEATIATLNERVDALKTPDRSGQRRVVTILFVDTVDSTFIVRGLDPEESLDIMATALNRLTIPIDQYGGRVTTYMGDGFKAVFGLPSTRENDAEMAVRAGLDLIKIASAYALELKATYDIQSYQIRVGIHTGWVAVGGSSENEGTVAGAAVNLAARLESAAEPGTVLISHDTFQYIRGSFNVKPSGRITAKGFTEPISAYQVLGVKARSFLTGRRGAMDFQTRMVGRAHELGMLQEAFLDVLEGLETRVVTVVGEAGVGKSRLVYEFEDWLQQRPESMSYYKGRAAPLLQNVPNALFRDLFTFRFDIRETDNSATAIEKFRVGTAGRLPSKHADTLGHWLGFDFSASYAVQQVLGTVEFSEYAKNHLIRYFQEVAATEPVAIILEDIHWADENSLDLINHLATKIPTAHLLIIPVTRLTLFDRRPHWGEGQQAFHRLELRRLSRRTTCILVDEILQRPEVVPDALYRNIVDVAEGNPLYIEELIKMYVDQRIIDTKNDRWHVLPDRLNSIRIPLTLTGLLQARLDALPHQERQLLQNASVIGRVFWDKAIASILSIESEEIETILTAVRNRELVLQRERSRFANTNEYIFKHSLFHEVAYDTVLLKQRAELHDRTARWLEASAGERLGEFYGLIARHYETAGKLMQAASNYGRAAESAYDRFTLDEALIAAQRAVDLLSDVDSPQVRPMRLQNLLSLVKVISLKGDLLKARQLLDRHLPEVRQQGDPLFTITWLKTLAHALIMQGDLHEGRDFLEEGLSLARQSGEPRILFDILLSLSHLGWRSGELPGSMPYVQEALALAEAIGDQRAIGRATMLLAFYAEMVENNPDEALRLHQQIVSIGRDTGDMSLLAQSLNNVGYTFFLIGDFRLALKSFEEAMVIEREVGWDQGISYTACWMAISFIQLEKMQEAESCLKEGMRLALETNRIQTILYGILGHAWLRLKTGRVLEAIELVGLVQSHRGYVEVDHGVIKEGILHETGGQISSDAIQAALQNGAMLDFETVLTELSDEVVPNHSS